MDPEESMMEREFTISKESKYKIAQNCLSDWIMKLKNQF